MTPTQKLEAAVAKRLGRSNDKEFYAFESVTLASGQVLELRGLLSDGNIRPNKFHRTWYINGEKVSKATAQAAR